ncbi:MAG: phage antirepressor N-terminal domain-containing protein [Methylovulum sp.]|nr:phage antirepressor N-terminal domain-containing protein [Methylovulum sp.]
MTTQSSQALTLNFHGTDLFIVDYNGQPYTPMKQIVEGMGLGWSAQLAKLNANPERWGMVKIAIPTLGDMQEAVCMPLRKLCGWLSGIYPNKVKPELREKIIFYQNECDDALWDYWQSKQQPQTSYGLKSLPIQQTLLPEPPTVTKAQAGELYFIVDNKARSSGKGKPYYWSRFLNHFKLNSYKETPAAKFEEAHDYLLRLEGENNPLFTLSQEELQAIVNEAVAKAINSENPPKPETPAEFAGIIRVLTTVTEGKIDQQFVAASTCLVNTSNPDNVLNFVRHHVPDGMAANAIRELANKLAGQR